MRLSSDNKNAGKNNLKFILSCEIILEYSHKLLKMSSKYSKKISYVFLHLAAQDIHSYIKFSVHFISIISCSQNGKSTVIFFSSRFEESEES